MVLSVTWVLYISGLLSSLQSICVVGHARGRSGATTRPADFAAHAPSPLSFAYADADSGEDEVERLANISQKPWPSFIPSHRVLAAAQRSRKQAAYASKSVAISSPCIAVQCRDGVFIAALMPKSLMRLPTRWIKRKRHLFRISDTAVAAVTGIYSDCVHLVDTMRSVAAEHRIRLREDVPIRVLCDAIAERLFDCNNDEGRRTMAVSCIISSVARRSSNRTQNDVDFDATSTREIYSIHLDGTYEGPFVATCTHAQYMSQDLVPLLRSRDWRALTTAEAEAEVRRFCRANLSTASLDIHVETYSNTCQDKDIS